MDQQSKKDLGVLGGLATMVVGAITVIVNGSKDDKKKT
jgi:hypothetical protein